MMGCLKLKKNAKIEAIAKHVTSQGLKDHVKQTKDLVEEESEDSELSDDDGMDEVHQ